MLWIRINSFMLEEAETCCFDCYLHRVLCMHKLYFSGYEVYLKI